MKLGRLLSSIVAVAAAAALAACGKPEKPPEVIRPVKLVQVAAPGVTELAVFHGEIKPRHEADLGFRIGGKLVARTVDVGMRVRKGQVLARLDPADTGLQAEAAQAQVAATETEYKFAQAEFERYQNLYREKFISASALDAKRNALDANRARYEQAKANLSVSRNQASYATLAADADGVVTVVNAEPGQVVGAGQSVVRIAREAEREVAIAVPENRLAELSQARPELFVALWANPTKRYRAQVREVAPAVDAVTRTFAVRVSILDADAAVQWGMTANVGVVAPTAASGWLLPLTSLYHQDGKPAVWRYDPTTHKVSLVPVTIGQYREDGILVTSGVSTGDWIVAAGGHKLVPGQMVRPYEGSTVTNPPGPPQPARSGRPPTAS